MGNSLSKCLQTTFLRVSPSPGLSHHHSVGYLPFTNSFYLKLIILNTHNLNVNRGTWSISFDKISALAHLKRTLNYLTNLAFWGKSHPSPSLPTMTLGLCSPICAQILWKKLMMALLGISSCSWDIIFPTILWFYLIFDLQTRLNSKPTQKNSGLKPLTLGTPYFCLKTNSCVFLGANNLFHQHPPVFHQVPRPSVLILRKHAPWPGARAMPQPKVYRLDPEKVTNIFQGRTTTYWEPTTETTMDQR